MNENLDYSIIWKYFNASLTTTEEEELNKWLADDIRHQQYFNKLKEQYAIDPDSENIKPSSSVAWKNIQLAPKHKRLHYWRIGIAATVLLCVAAYFGTQILTGEQEQFVSIENIQFEPGVKKATLILDSGEELKLESAKDTLITEAEVTIKNHHSQLDYKAVQKSKEEDVKKEIKYNTLIVPRGGEYSLTLSDGSEITVNSESIVKYPVVFEGTQRNIQLVGEAFFDVKSDPKRPFIVTSGEHVVKVYGTSFNVKSYTNDNYVATTLVEGKVALSTTKEDALEQVLNPGYQSIYKKELKEFDQQKVDIREFVSWKDGRFYFRNMRLDEMTDVLGRWYDVEFHFKNEKAKDITFNGNLKKYENIQTILNQLVKTNEITFTAYDKIIYVD